MNKVASIQYLRALAVLLVIAFHASIRTDFSGPLLAFFRIGGAGVDLFFIISGFIMWMIAAERPTSAGAFALRRITRIVPLYWLTTAAWTILAIVALSWVKVTPEHILLSLFFIPHFSPSYPGEVFPILVPGWTLTYEMFFYAVFALTLFARRGRLAILSAALVALVLMGLLLRPQDAIGLTYTNPLLLEFLAGILIANAWHKQRIPTGITAATILFIGLVALCTTWIIALDENVWRTAIFGIPAALIVIGALGCVRETNWLKPALAIGNASYSIYLSHIIIVTLAEPAWKKLIHPNY